MVYGDNLAQLHGFAPSIVLCEKVGKISHPFHNAEGIVNCRFSFRGRIIKCALYLPPAILFFINYMVRRAQQEFILNICKE